MNRKLIGFSAACAVIAGTGSYQAFGDKVPLTQLPERVQKAIKDYSKGENLKEVDREMKDGQPVYEAEFKREGLNRRVKFSADGTMLPSSELADAFSGEPTIPMSELPAAVQRTVREQQGGRAVADIDKEAWNGQIVYEVEFKEKGPNSRIYIAPDGSMVVNKDQAKGGYLGTQLSATPKEVRDTVQRLAGNAEIADVDREMKDGKAVYDVEIRQEGLNRHLLIAESGMLVSDSGAGKTTLGDRVRGTSERVRERIDDRLHGKTMAFTELPAPVQSTIKANGDVAHLKPIKCEVKNGVVRYDVEFEKQGKNTRLKISDDGRILDDNR